MAKNPLTPRETVMRMLEHTHDDATYEDIIRQLRILQDIENTMADVDLGGSPADDVLDEARSNIEEHEPGASEYQPSPNDLILHSRPSDDWRSLSDAPDDDRDPLLQKAEWLY